jgi:hypothetical protein
MATTNNARNVTQMPQGDSTPDVRFNMATIEKLGRADDHLVKSIAGSDAALTLSEAEAQYGSIELTGARTAVVNLQIDITLGHARKITFYNNTTGGYTVTIKIKDSAGTTVAVPAGTRRAIQHDGVNVYDTGAFTYSDPLTTKGDILTRTSSATARQAVGSNGQVLTADSAQTNGIKWAALPVELVIACSDETTNLTTGTAKATFRSPFAFTLTAVRASVNTAPTGSTILVDVNENGVSVFSTRVSIDASEKTSTTAATPAVISDSAIADDAEITIDIDQVGSTIAGKGLKVVLIGTRV